MSKRTLILLKTLTWIACLIPLAILVSDAVTNRLGPDPTAAIEFSTGKSALHILLISLAITPARMLWSRLSWMVKFRRLLGLFCFFYASLHLFAYIGLYAYFSVDTMAHDIVKRRFITVGVAAWVLLLPLALTSTTGAIKRLGGKRWQRLHKVVYLAAILAIIHYWWQVKQGVTTPFNDTLILAALLLLRPVLTWWKSRRTHPAPTPRPA